MKTSFISKALILQELFDKRLRFNIPLYQRPYSWSADDASRLLDDIVSAMGDDPTGYRVDNYFLGAIILTGVNRQRHNEAPNASLGKPITEVYQELLDSGYAPSIRNCCDFEIVDGKQRMITLLTLLSLLRDLASAEQTPAFAALIGDDSAENPYRLKLSGGERQYFIEHVLLPGSSVRQDITDGLPNSQKNILYARDQLHDMLRDYSPEQRQRLLGYLLGHCEIVVMVTSEFNNAYQIFLSINETGTDLVQGDILKVELMTKLSPELRDQYMGIWETWNDSLGEPETKHGARKTFFNHFWYALTPTPNNMLMDIRARVDTVGGAVPFIDNYLVPHARAYERIKAGVWPHVENKAEMEHLLGVLSWLAQDEWMSAAMLAHTTFERMRETNKGQAPHDWILAFFRRLERLAYCLLIEGTNAPNRRKRFNPARRRLRDGGNANDVLKELDIEANELRMIRHTLATGLHRSRSQAARIVLLRLDQATSNQPLSFYSDLLAEENFTVEHLLPLNPRDGSQWTRKIPDTKQRNALCDSLGNLFLVREKTENPKMKNYDFNIKHEILFRDRPEHPIALTESLRQQSDWTSADIEARQQRLLVLLDRMWNLKG